MSRAGYDPFAMSHFLSQLDRYDHLKDKAGSKNGAANIFATHPVTSERVAMSSSLATKYPAVKASAQSHEVYLAKIRGMIFGDNMAQGFVRSGMFYHPDLGMAFSIPKGFDTVNQPNQVVAKGADGSLLVMDMARSNVTNDPVEFMSREWLKGKAVTSNPERITVNGMQGATLSVKGTVNNTPADLRVVAINWTPRDFVRFQIVLPQSASRQSVEDLKRTTYSLRRMSAQEKRSVKPATIQVVTAAAGDTVQSLARQMDVEGDQVSWFRVVNGLGAQDKVYSGVSYKIIR